MAGCCGTPAGAMAAVQGLIDKGVASGAMVKLIYIGGDATVRPYTVDGNVYMFGNTERRRVNAVAARVAPYFLSAQSPYYGKFARWEEATFTQEGLPKAAASGQVPLFSTSPEQALNTSGQRPEDVQDPALPVAPKKRKEV